MTYEDQLHHLNPEVATDYISNLKENVQIVEKPKIENVHIRKYPKDHKADWESNTKIQLVPTSHWD